MEKQILYSNVLVKEEFIPTDWQVLIGWIMGGFDMTIRIGDMTIKSDECLDCIPSVTEWYVEKGRDRYNIETDKTRWRIVDNRTWLEREMDEGPDPTIQWQGSIGDFYAEKSRILTQVIALILEESGGQLEKIIVRSGWNIR